MKSKTVAALLAFFLGGVGAHKFYLGNKGQGILYLIFVWTGVPAIIGLFDAILILIMDDREFQKKYGKNAASSKVYSPIIDNVDVDEQPQISPSPQIQDSTTNTEIPHSIGVSSSIVQAKKIAANTKAKQPQ